MSVNAIATKLQTRAEVVKAALAYIDCGGTPPMLLIPVLTQNGKPMSKDVEAKVVRLRKEGLSFRKIGKQLGIGNDTAAKAYDRGGGEEDAGPHKRGRYQHLAKEVFQKIDSMLKEGHSDSDIAKAAGCALNTVRRFKRKQQQ